jgi:hypothetical protein
MTIIRLAALIALLAASLALSTDDGSCIDPNGRPNAIDGGGAMDPNGAGSGIDTNCYSICVDPNG